MDRIIAVFSTQEDALRAQAALVRCGIDPQAIGMSTDFTSDPIAAEAPGEAYEHQGTPGLSGLKAALKSGRLAAEDSDTREAKRIATVERGSVALTVGPLTSRELESAERMLFAEAVALTRY
jgi:hypothetical protein